MFNNLVKVSFLVQLGEKQGKNYYRLSGLSGLFGIQVHLTFSHALYLCAHVYTARSGY